MISDTHTEGSTSEVVVISQQIKINERPMPQSLSPVSKCEKKVITFSTEKISLYIFALQ